MVKRVLTSVLGLPVLMAFVIVGGAFLKAGVFVLISIGMYEVYRALCDKKNVAQYAGYAFAAIYLFFVDRVGSSNVMMILLTSFMLVLMTLLVLFHNRITVVDCAVTIFGFFYVCVLLSAIYLVRESAWGDILVWLIFITAWGSDTGAYCVGKLFGKHKLIPSLSPKKTVEGAIGGVLTSAALAIIYGIIISSLRNRIDNPHYLIVYGVFGILGGVFSQFGDLTASAVKRYTKIKDFGSILPGHGGVIDRFDSVMFTAPAVFLIILAVVK